MVFGDPLDLSAAEGHDVAKVVDDPPARHTRPKVLCRGDRRPELWIQHKGIMSWLLGEKERLVSTTHDQGLYSGDKVQK